MLKNTDFVSVWKAASIILTGAFGILGLATDFRNKEKPGKPITMWGYISLVGILVSTICGFAAQIKESTDNSQKALAVAET